MSLLDTVTPLILTYNEEANIGRTLERLSWARRILVIDSGSTDQTLQIIQAHKQAAVLTRPFDSFAKQCNFGLDHIDTPWVLSLDADYELSAKLIAELSALSPSDDIAGYAAPFVYRVHGKNLRGTLYPPRTVLYRTKVGRYRDEGHGHRVEIAGAIAKLRHPIYHDDRKPLSVWLRSQQRYAQVEAAHLLALARTERSPADRVRLTGWLAPILAPLYALIVKGCIFDGAAGWFYALQRALAEIMLALEILDARGLAAQRSRETGE
jgi:glycosyltransferase involved in cell wall biosynthesis